jgi:hypothetical protein
MLAKDTRRNPDIPDAGRAVGVPLFARTVSSRASARATAAADRSELILHARVLRTDAIISEAAPG